LGVGDGREHDGDPTWDDQEANQLYTLLEDEVIPLFYRCDQDGVPVGWIDRVRASMSRLTSQFSANRVVREYTETHYAPCARANGERIKDGGAAAAQLVRWRKAVDEHWPSAALWTARSALQRNTTYVSAARVCG
jgi:starch phosphorylase